MSLESEKYVSALHGCKVISSQLFYVQNEPFLSPFSNVDNSILLIRNIKYMYFAILKLVEYLCIIFIH